MATSEVAIVNNALGMLGDKPIVALDESSDRASLASRLYATIRDSVLRAYPWNFAIRRVALAQSADVPSWEYKYQYALPSNPYCLKVLETNIDDTDAWRIEGRFLLTDAKAVKIRYIAKIEDPVQFDDLFTEAFTAKLALEMAYALTSNKSLTDSLYQLYKEKLKEARATDASENSSRTTQTSTLTDVR